MRKRNQRAGEIAGHWLSKRTGSDAYYATWYDHDRGRNRQTRRVSLGTDDLREAELALVEFIAKNAPMHGEPLAETPLATVLLRYWHGHASKIASKVQAKIALALWNEFWGEATVSDLTIARQETFIVWLKDRGYKNAYVSRVLSVGRAALNRARKRQEIASAPFVLDVPDRSDAEEAYRLSAAEMIRLLNAARHWPHIFTFCMIGLNTLARPDAILDLSPFQVDLDIRRITLNPPGRKQTKKFRPVVPITDTLLPFVVARDCVRFVTWNSKPIRRIKKTFAKAVKAAGLPAEVTPYSLRHTMATELRRRGVPVWEVSALLGHKAGGITETYAKYDPDYLSKGSRAIDAYFADLGMKFVGQNPEPGLQLRASSVSVPERHFPQVLDLMVGATGIEPVTPTMST